MSKVLQRIYELLSRIINEIQFRIVVNKLKKLDLIADIDDQRFHHFS